MCSIERLTRRTFLGGIAGLGGAALLASCGAGNVPTISPTASIAPASTTPPSMPTPVASAAVPAATATRGVVGTVSTATRAATTGTTRTPIAGAAGESPLLRALALVPKRDPLPGTEGLSFADLQMQKRNYGLEGATSAETFQALGVSIATFSNVTAGLPVPREAGLEYARVAEWREATGYDFWQIERTISAGSPPNIWTRLEGRLDRAAITAALTSAGHQPQSYGGATILARGSDGQIVDLQQPLTRYTLAQLNRVVIDDNALSASPFTALIEAGIAVRSAREGSFAADPDYAALAGSLGAVVGARLVPAAQFLGPPPNPRATPRAATPRATPGSAALPPYRLVGLGLRDDGTNHTMLVALLYGDPAAARAAAPIVRERAASYRLLATNQPLSERAVVGQPNVVVAADRATVVLPFAIGELVDLGLWQRMLFQRDYGFLVS